MFLERAKVSPRRNIPLEVKDDGGRGVRSVGSFSQIDVKLTQLPATSSQVVHVVENQCSVKLPDYSHYPLRVKKLPSKCASSPPNFFNTPSPLHFVLIRPHFFFFFNNRQSSFVRSNNRIVEEIWETRD